MGDISWLDDQERLRKRTMEIKRLRVRARQFVLGHGLQKTAGSIRSNCYSDIFDIAIKELASGNEKKGFRKMICLLREAGDMNWIARFWFHVRGTRVQHFDLSFRCEIWSKIAWLGIRHRDKEFAKEVLRELDYSLSPDPLIESRYFSDKFRQTLRALAA